MTKREKNTRSILIHKFNMMFIETEGRGDYRTEARKIVEAIWTEYTQRNDSALWVYRIIKDYKSGNTAKIDGYVL